MALVYLGLLVAAFIPAILISRTLGYPVTPYVVGIAPVFVELAKRITDAVLKHFGLSRSGNRQETRTRAPATGEAGLEALQPVELVRAPVVQGIIRFACVLFPLVAVASLSVAIACHITAAYWLAALCTTMSLVAQWSLWTSSTMVRADECGLWGYPSAPSLRPRYLTWAEIARCEIITRRDTFGTIVRIQPKVYPADGGRPITLDLTGVLVVDQGRLADYLQAKLPENASARQ